MTNDTNRTPETDAIVLDIIQKLADIAPKIQVSLESMTVKEILLMAAYVVVSIESQAAKEDMPTEYFDIHRQLFREWYPDILAGWRKKHPEEVTGTMAFVFPKKSEVKSFLIN